jgi:hypothetical protein
MTARKSWIWLFPLLVLVACWGPGTAPNPAPVASDAGASNQSPPPTPANVSVLEDPVDFGFADCGGGSPADRSVQITNAGGGTFAWSASIDQGGFSIVGPTSGSFAGTGSAAVTVRAAPISASADAASTLRATLIVVIDNTKTFRVPLSVTSHGATLTLQPAAPAFGDWPVNTQAPDQALTIKNTGNAEATVSFSQPSAGDFALSWTGAPSAVKVAAGATVPGAVARFRPSNITAQSTSAGISVAGPVCGQSVSSVAMTGKGTGGFLGFSPGTLDFGLVNCGSTATPLQFTIINNGNANLTWTGALGQGVSSPYAVSATGGILTPNQAVQITVTPKAIPSTSAITPNLYGDTFTITTNNPADQPGIVVIKETARGAILATSAPSLSFGTQVVGAASASSALNIINTGNAPAQVKYVVGGGATSSFIASPSALATVGAGGTLNGNVASAPLTFGAVADQVSISTSDVLCQPLPAAVAVDAVGKGLATQVAVAQVNRRYNSVKPSACALLTTGYVACWGSNSYGQLGDGSSVSSSATPVLVKTAANALLSGVTAIASAGIFHCGLRAGEIWCWGSRPPDNNQLNPASPPVAYATKTVGVSGVTAIGTSHRHYCYLQPDGTGNSMITCTGSGWNNDKGFLKGTGLASVKSIGVSGTGGCALLADKSVKCWGNNGHGEVGCGTTTGCSSGSNIGPLAVPGLTATAIASAGGGGRGSVNCAIKTDNTAVCWGNGRHGRNGNGVSSNTGTGAPAAVLYSGTALPNVTQISVGTQHACALAGGSVYCWGNSMGGALGPGGVDGATANKLTLANVASVTAGGQSSCALMMDQSVQCWGAIGDGLVPGF